MNDTPTTTAGDLIRQLREKSGMSQEELAEKLHITKGQVARYEDAKNNISVKTFTRIMEAIGYHYTIKLKPIEEVE